MNSAERWEKEVKSTKNGFKVVCLPVNSNNIPPHLVKPLLAKAGLISDLVCYSDDSEDVIKERITKLFPTVLSNFSGFDFMSKTANFLKKRKNCFSARALEGLIDKDGFICNIINVRLNNNKKEKRRLEERGQERVTQLRRWII